MEFVLCYLFYFENCFYQNWSPELVTRMGDFLYQKKQNQKRLRFMRERLPRLGYGGPTHYILWLLLSLWTHLSPNTSNGACMMLPMYLPVLLYSNNVSPPKASKVQNPHPLLATVILFSFAHSYGLGLCFFLVHWSVICCHDGCFMVRQRRIARRVSLSQFWWALLGGHQAYLVPFLP